MKIIEQLGEFYLGNQVDVKTLEKAEAPFLYASADLTTHAMIVGMTGSGKTGLGIDLLEEAIIDGLPALVIDPKGDMSNLLLRFPSICRDDLLPWISASMAEQAGQSREDFAQAEAERWENGRMAAGMDAARVEQLAQADITVYTPGSHSGTPLSILNLTTPSESLRQDTEALQSYISSTVAGLLSLIGLDADPLTDREFILLSTLFTARWSVGESVDLPSLITAIQKPQLDKIGVMPLESFYPEKDRFALAMRFNNLLASPQYATWMEGKAMDPQALLYTPEGKPRVAILSIGHLSDRERMFVVTLLLNQVVAWMRRQPGQSALRALLYMDEVHGYFPPVSNPPSKEPMLTLLKQARAFGLGVVLATQNPADLDYKGLSNIGTWFIGHLQTQQDRDRLLDGLDTGAEGGQSRSAMNELLSRLPKRTFYVNNVHERSFSLLSTRWTMSYLAGPLTGEQLKQLQPAMTSQPKTDATTVAPVIDQASATSTAMAESTPPVAPKGVEVYYVPNQGEAIYMPYVMGMASIFYEDEKAGVHLERKIAYLTDVPEAPQAADWDDAECLDPADLSLHTQAPAGATFAPVSLDGVSAAKMTAWKNGFKNALYAKERLTVPYHPGTKTYGKPGEEGQFAIRMEGALREQRDQKMKEVKEKYQKKLDAMQERIRKAQLAVQREETQANAAKQSTLVSLGSALLSGILGSRKPSATMIGRMSSSARSFSRQRAQEADTRRAEENVAAYQEELQKLEDALAEELQQIGDSFSVDKEQVESVEIKPKKSNIQVQNLFLVWKSEA